MARFFKKREETRSQSPGTLIFIGNKKVENIRLRVIDYDQAQLVEDDVKNISDGTKFKQTKTVTWINVDLHPLLVEDLLNTGQRPKLGVFDNCLFIVEKMGEKIEDIEKEILEKADPGVMEKVNAFKREMNYLRISVRPAREAIIQLSKMDSELQPFSSEFHSRVNTSCRFPNTRSRNPASQLPR